MAIPEIEMYRVNKLFSQYCEQRIPPHARGQVKLIYQIKGNKVALIEARPYYDDPTKWTEMPIAQFEYSVTTKSWSLYSYNRNSKRIPITKGTLEKLISEVDKDRSGMFWG